MATQQEHLQLFEEMENLRELLKKAPSSEEELNIRKELYPNHEHLEVIEGDFTSNEIESRIALLKWGADFREKAPGFPGLNW